MIWMRSVHPEKLIYYKKEKSHRWIRRQYQKHNLSRTQCSPSCLSDHPHVQSGCSMCTRTFQQLKKDVLELSWQEFAPSSPPKPFNHQKQGGGSLLPSSPSPASKQPLLTPQKQQIWRHPPTPFLSLRRHSRAMWSPPIVTAQRRPASGCGEERDGWLTVSPKVGANTLLYIFIHQPTLFI